MKQPLSAQSKIKTMQLMLLFSLLLMGIKFLAYGATRSNAILTDALESIINVVAGAFALFSLYYAAQPRDTNHPYGHGKIEFLSAGFEGGLIFMAGAGIIGKAFYGFWHPTDLARLDLGAGLSALAGLCNFLMGRYLITQGTRSHSITMVADGHHLISDTISSVGLVLGLVFMHLTGVLWVDNALALVFGIYILVTGLRLIKESIINLLDEADMSKLTTLISILEKKRQPPWIDIHNLRVIKYGVQLHVDAHITLPWYQSLEEAHLQMNAVEVLVRNELGSDIEFFIHADPCRPSSCPLCTVTDCSQRKAPFIQKVTWTLNNILQDKRHELIP